MTGDLLSLLGTNLALMVVVMSLIAIPSFRTRDPSYVDAFWGVGFVVVAASTLLQTDGDPLRSWLLVGLCSVWGLRLGGYLLWRWRRNGPDVRYQRMLSKNDGNEAVFLWSRVFLLQAVLLTVVSLPVQLGQLYSAPAGLSVVNVIGVVLAVFGIGFETLADAQLTRFKADPSKRGQVMDAGLWRFSRHPNYFGEACVWWGLFLLCVVNLPTALAVVGPLVITFLLMRWSGVGPLERQLKRSKPHYVDYIATTSGFVPLPRRHTSQTSQLPQVAQEAQR